jgi:predicted transcriptional regulator of viral defense system
MAAWLAAGRDGTVVSHESALDLLNLSDVIPNAVHLTVPRSRRHLPRLLGVAFHTTSRSLRPEDVTVRDGIRLTAPPRTIVDAAEAGTGPEQIEMAVSQALSRGLTTPAALRHEADGRSRRVTRLVYAAIDQAV